MIRGLDLRLTLAAFTLAATSLLGACDLHDRDEPARTVRQSVVQSEIRLRYPRGSDGGVPVVSFAGQVYISDRARLELPNGQPIGVSQLGPGGVEVGASARVGSVVAEGNVFLRSSSIVSGDVTTSGTITHQNNTTVTGQQMQGAVVTPYNEETLQIPVHSVNGQNVNLEPDQSRNLAPGAYSQLNVKSRATLYLRAGDYAFTGVAIEPDAKILVDDGLGPVRVFVDNGFTFRGKVLTANQEPPALLVVQLGSSPIAMLDATFRGTVIAPNAEIVLGPGNQPHEGAFMGRSVNVRADTKVVYRPYYRLAGEPAFQLASSPEFGRYGVVHPRGDGQLLVEGPQGPVRVSTDGAVAGPFVDHTSPIVLGEGGEYFGVNAPEHFRVYDASGSLVYEQARDAGSVGRLVPGSRLALLPEVTGDPENTDTTHARFYDESGLVARFPVPGFEVSRLTSTHLIYTTKTELKKVDFQGHQVWSVPLAIRRFVLSRDGSVLLGVVNTRARGEVVHVDLDTGSVLSTTVLDGAYWNMDISASGAASAVTSRDRLYVYADGVLRKEIALPFKWAASVSVSEDGKALVGGQRENHVATLLLTGPPGAGAWTAELPVETAGYRPDVTFLADGERFSANETRGLTVYDIVRTK